MTCDRTRGRRPQGRGPAIREGGGADRLREGPDLVPGDGFLLQQDGGEPGEGLPVCGESAPGGGLGFGEQGSTFLAAPPLGVLGVPASAAGRVIPGTRAAV